jgi:hypothetical protein
VIDKSSIAVERADAMVGSPPETIAPAHVNQGVSSHVRRRFPGAAVVAPGFLLERSGSGDQPIARRIASISAR